MPVRLELLRRPTVNDAVRKGCALRQAAAVAKWTDSVVFYLPDRRDYWQTLTGRLKTPFVCP